MKGSTAKGVNVGNSERRLPENASQATTDDDQLSPAFVDCTPMSQSSSLCSQERRVRSRPLKRRLLNVFENADVQQRGGESMSPKRRRSGDKRDTESDNEHSGKQKKGVQSFNKQYPARSFCPLTERQQLQLLKQQAAVHNETQQVPSNSTNKTPSGPRVRTRVIVQDASSVARLPARLDKRNERGETPLHLAAIRGDNKLVSAMIKHGAEINSKDHAGWTPLHEACNHGHTAVVRTLLEGGANVNVRGMDDDTPLHDAAMNDHVEVVQLLLQYNAGAANVNQHGQTALDMARHGRHAATIAVLEQAMGLGKQEEPTPLLGDGPAGNGNTQEESNVDQSVTQKEAVGSPEDVADVNSLASDDVPMDDEDDDLSDWNTECTPCSTPQQPLSVPTSGLCTPDNGKELSCEQDNTRSVRTEAANVDRNDVVQRSPSPAIASDSGEEALLAKPGILSSPLRSKTPSTPKTCQLFHTMPLSQPPSLGQVSSPKKTPVRQLLENDEMSPISTSAQSTLDLKLNVTCTCSNRSPVTLNVASTATGTIMVATTAVPSLGGAVTDQEKQVEQDQKYVTSKAAKSVKLASNDTVRSLGRQTSQHVKPEASTFPPRLRYKHCEPFRLSSLLPLMNGHYYRPPGFESYQPLDEEVVPNSQCDLLKRRELMRKLPEHCPQQLRDLFAGFVGEHLSFEQRFEVQMRSLQEVYAENALRLEANQDPSPKPLTYTEIYLAEFTNGRKLPSRPAPLPEDEFERQLQENLRKYETALAGLRCRHHLEWDSLVGLQRLKWESLCKELAAHVPFPPVPSY